MKFQLKKGFPFFLLLVILPIATILFGAFTILLEVSNLTTNQLVIIGSIIILISILVYLLSIRSYYNSYYLILNNNLQCKMGFFKKEISIDRINAISNGSYPTSALFKPALDFNGINISYGEGYVIFLSPEDKIQLINKLQEINPSIRYAPTKK